MTPGPGGKAPVPWKRPPRERVRRIRDRLREMYGRPVNLPHREPVDELVRTILSQATSDANRDRAFASLVERFAVWDTAGSTVFERGLVKPVASMAVTPKSRQKRSSSTEPSSVGAGCSTSAAMTWSPTFSSGTA